MTSHPYSHRIGQALAVALTGLALAAPATIAQQPTDGPTSRPLYPAPGSSWGTSEPPAAQAPAARGEGAPATPHVQSSHAGFEWSSAAIGAAGTAGLIALGSLGAAAIGRTRLHTAR